MGMGRGGLETLAAHLMEAANGAHIAVYVGSRNYAAIKARGDPQMRLLCEVRGGYVRKREKRTKGGDREAGRESETRHQRSGFSDGAPIRALVGRRPSVAGRTNRPD
ncbi:hypothetical protein MTO96_013477 [Rhipicephalus appendiculatus]